MQNIDLRQTKKNSLLMKKLGWIVYKTPSSKLKNTNKIFIWKIPNTPFSFIRAYRINRPIPFQILKKLEKQYCAISIRIEPFSLSSNIDKKQKKLIYQYKYKKDTWCHFPSKTIKIDLTEKLDEIINKMQKKTQYNIKLAKKRGVIIKTHNGEFMLRHQHFLRSYHRLLHSNAQRLNIASFPLPWLKTLASVFKKDSIFCLAFLKNKLVAGSMFISDKKGLYYLQNCSTKIGRKNDASSLLIYQAIVEGKNRKLLFLDLEGIYDKRYADANKTWKGFTNFKLGFGGKIEEYEGSYVKNNFNQLNKVSQTQIKLLSPKYLPLLYPEKTYDFTYFEVILRKLLRTKDYYV